jgi:hypothetical protein
MLKVIHKDDQMRAWKDAPYTGFAWAEDFVKALAERPKIVRLMLRFVFGRKAYREFIGLTDTMIAAGRYFNYELDEMDYHREKVRSDFMEGAERY